MRRQIGILLVQILADHILEILGSNLYREIPVPVSKNDVLKSESDASKFQCIHRCHRHAQCIDIAMREDGLCFLLRPGDLVKNGSVVVGAQRVSPVKLPRKYVFNV